MAALVCDLCGGKLVMGAGGNGLFNLDMSKFDMTMYIYRI